MTKKRQTATIEARRSAGNAHEVLTLKSGPNGHRRTPCTGCPWRVDTVGLFPAEAFCHSAGTAQDMAVRTFACHEQGAQKPATCAGFILRGAAHNLTMRLKWARGECLDVSDGGHALHESYRAMALANGVAPDDPALAKVRP